MIPYGQQDIQKADIDAVLEVLGSDFLTQGPKVPAFEQAVASHIGAKHGVVVNSATSALHIACLALGLGAGDLLWTSPITFVASANAGKYCGAEVDFVDIDPYTFNLCPEALEAKLIQAQANSRLPKVVVPVALCGQSCNMEAIHALAQEYGFKILEDASHAIGAGYKGGFVGDGRFSDITVFSFHPVKIITTAEGGLAVTNDTALAQRMDLLRSHGITRNPELMKNVPVGTWYYEQIDLGFNYRMTELQAALGLSQLERLDAFVKRRQEICARYDAVLTGLPVELPGQSPDCSSSRHLYVIRTQPEQHRFVFDYLRAQGIGVNLHYIPVHLQPYYQRLGFRLGDFPNAESYYERAISIPVYATMTYEQQDKVVAVIRAAFDAIETTV